MLQPTSSRLFNNVSILTITYSSAFITYYAGVLSAESPQDIVDILFSSEGIQSSDVLEQRAANLAISSAMADAPASIYPPLHAALVTAINHREHDAISPTEAKIYFTPAGQCQTCAIIERILLNMLFT